MSRAQSDPAEAVRPDPVAVRLVAQLAQSGQTVATCESITGGLICASLTAPAGASQVVRGALVTYMTDLKTSLAQVPAATVAEHGVVSEAVALAMAEAARRVCQATWGIGVTGVAGPGPAEGQPAGTVWLALAGPVRSWARLSRLTGERQEVRQAVVQVALRALTEALAVDWPACPRSLR